MNKFSPTGESFLTMAAQLNNELVNTSIIQKYKSAQSKLNADATAMKLLRRLSDARNEINKMQMTGTFIPEVLNNYGEIQNEVESNPTIMEYSLAQQEAIQLLKNVNFEISQLIGIDFSSLIKRQTNC